MIFFILKRLFILLALIPYSALAINIGISGTGVENICRLSPDSFQQNIVFPKLSDHFFNYSQGVGPKEKFIIKFIDCDGNLSNKILLAFKGQPEINMGNESNYFLKVQGSNAGRLGIGLTDSTGVPIKLGNIYKPEGKLLIGTKTVVLNFFSYVKAIKKNVLPGEYQSSVTFVMYYE